MEKDKTPERVATIEGIISNASNVPIEKMRGHERLRAFVDARMAVWFMAHDYLGLSYVKIAKLYKRNHSTVMHGVSKIRSTTKASTVVKGISEVCPGLLNTPGSDEALTVKDWKFNVHKNVDK